MPGFKPAKAMVRSTLGKMSVWVYNVVWQQVFAGIYPIESNDFPKLEESIKRVQWFVKADRT
jgi:translation elongation factor EF-4